MLRCLSNLLTEAAVEVMGGPNQLEDERVVVALFILLQFFLQKQPSLLPEGLWLLNNLTGTYHNVHRPRLLDSGYASSLPGLRWVGLGPGGGVGAARFGPQFEGLYPDIFPSSE